MARATRSTASVQQPPPPPPPIQRKRKRNSSPHLSINQKQHKTLECSDDSHPIEHHNDSLSIPAVFLTIDDAQKILDVLELSDTQGLLDRVFPLQVDSDPLYSLRALLKKPSKHPLTTIKSAVQHLLPITSLPRSRPSPAASQQLEFSNLAISLIEQASFHAISPILDKSSILESASEDDPFIKTSPILTQRKYALVQRLPAGDYWTSMDHIPSSDLKGLPTGHAELVAILPSSSSTSVDSIPTLASVSSKPFGPTKVIQGQRRITTGGFLDYGLFSSFAPSFEQNGEVVGREQLGEVLYQKEGERREADGLQTMAIEGKDNVEDTQGDITTNGDAPDSPPNVVRELNNLFSQQDIVALNTALGDLELENAVQELLERNQRALRRLEDLQSLRLRTGDASFIPMETGSEEWETAQLIMESLTALASLRPRSFTEDGPSLVPPPSVLRKLHKTLALGTSAGWYGNLPATRPNALHDDSTIKLLTDGPLPSTSTTAHVPATSIPASQTPASTNYAPYAYNYTATPQQQHPYRPAAGSYASYKPGQIASYYQSYIPATTQQGYYNQQSYPTGTSNQQPYGSTSTQQPYPYPNWFGQYPQTASGRGTPQPAGAAPPTYGSFFGTATVAVNGTSGARTPAVANTVNNKPTATGQLTAGTTGTWATPAYQPLSVGPTLPTHLRPVQATTPTATYQAQQAAGYFQTCQVPSR